jgi:hypothetical protein
VDNYLLIVMPSKLPCVASVTVLFYYHTVTSILQSVFIKLHFYFIFFPPLPSPFILLRGGSSIVIVPGLLPAATLPSFHLFLWPAPVVSPWTNYASSGRPGNSSVSLLSQSHPDLITVNCYIVCFNKHSHPQGTRHIVIIKYNTLPLDKLHKGLTYCTN